MTTVQAIYFTHRTAEWHRFAQDLGLAPAFEPDPSWSEFDGDGILAIHHADATAAAGTTSLHVLTDDLDAVELALRATGVAVTRDVMQDVGDVVIARTAAGVTVSASAGGRVAHGELRAQPIWSQDDGTEASQVLQALGLRERIRSNPGTWIDFEGDGGGLAAFHAGMSDAMTLSFEYAGSLEALEHRLTEAGRETSIVDEAYNRTLLVRTPDDWTLWINGQISDLYGYRKAE